MLEKCQDAKERWGGVSDIIDHWLEERQGLISAFVHLPQHPVDNELAQQVELFCELLMDYLSSGHFEVYEQLLREGSEFNDGSVEEAQKLFPEIQHSTNLALDFNDQYASTAIFSVQIVRELANDLSGLGEKLEERFELEDRMIEVLHTSHSNLTPEMTP
ncbi:MAG: sigma D regulator [Pontibacterium sp.]